VTKVLKEMTLALACDMTWRGAVVSLYTARTFLIWLVV